QVEFGSNAYSLTLVPWVTGPNPSFAVSGVAWSDEKAADYAKQSNIQSGYIVTSHIQSKNEPWIAEVRIIRTRDGNCIGQLSENFLMPDPVDAFQRLARQLLELIAKETEIEVGSFPQLYTIP